MPPWIHPERTSSTRRVYVSTHKRGTWPLQQCGRLVNKPRASSQRFLRASPRTPFQGYQA
eukprot:6074439-Prorocentrum_lima.AAC.1